MSMLARLVALPIGPLDAFLEECRDFEPALATALTRAMVPGDPSASVLFGPFHPSSNVRTRQIWLPDPHALDDEAVARTTAFLRSMWLHELGHLGVTGAGLSAALRGCAPGGHDPPSAAIASALEHHQRWGARFTGLAIAVEDIRVDRWVLETFPGAGDFQLAFYQVLSRLDGDPVVDLARGGALARLCGAIFEVGRYVLTIAELPSPTRELVERLGQSFEDALAARSDLEVVEATASMLVALEHLADDDDDANGAGGSVGMAALDLLTEPAPQVHGGCLHDDDAIRSLVEEILHRQPKAAPAPLPAGGASGTPATTKGLLSISGRHPTPSRPPLSTYRVLTKDFDEVVTYSSKELLALESAFRALVAEARRSCASLIDELAILLLGEPTMDLLMGARSGYAIDPAALPAIVAGADVSDVWIRPVHRVAAGSAAIMLLADCSGSMSTASSGGKTRAEIARIAVTALHLALAPGGVPHAIVGYSTVPRHVPGLQACADARARAGEDLDAYARSLTAIRHSVFKSFEQPVASAIAAIEPVTDAGNLDGEAVAFGLDMLRRRDEALKLLVVLTDGQPTNIRDASIELRYLQQVVERTSKEGVRCIGVGIASDAVREAYPEHIVVDNLTTLAPSLLELIGRVVLEA